MTDEAETVLRIGDQIFDLAPLRDPPVGLWELLEKRGLLTTGGELNVVGLSAGFDFLHIALCATKGLEAIEAMCDGAPPAVARSVVTGIVSSEFQSVMEKISAVMSVGAGDVTTLRPTRGKSSRQRTRSPKRTDGRSETSAP